MILLKCLISLSEEIVILWTKVFSPASIAGLYTLRLREKVREAHLLFIGEPSIGL
jgi:hypothetical protein